MNYSWLLILIFLFGGNNIFAQKVLQMEISGKVKTKKFYLGEEITYQLKGSKDWHTEILVDVKIEEKLVVFTNRYVKVQDLAAIKTFKLAQTAKNVERGMYTFGASWLLFSLGGTLFDEQLTWAAAIVPATAAAIGWTFRKIFFSKKHKIGKRKRLRVLDISFNKQMHFGP